MHLLILILNQFLRHEDSVSPDPRVHISKETMARILPINRLKIRTKMVCKCKGNLHKFVVQEEGMFNGLDIMSKKLGKSKFNRHKLFVLQEGLSNGLAIMSKTGSLSRSNLLKLFGDSLIPPGLLLMMPPFAGFSEVSLKVSGKMVGERKINPCKLFVAEAGTFNSLER